MPAKIRTNIIPRKSVSKNGREGVQLWVGVLLKLKDFNKIAFEAFELGAEAPIVTPLPKEKGIVSARFSFNSKAVRDKFINKIKKLPVKISRTNIKKK